MGKVLFFGFLGLWILSGMFKDRLPGQEEIMPELFREPKQTPTENEPFSVKAKDIKYTITPLYNYELYGLIVSYHHSSVWWDLDHDQWKDYLNVKDLCVVWGENIKNGVYDRMTYHSGSWTCYMNWKDWDTGKLYHANALSNNHLLTADPDLSQKILKAQAGDQIYLKGHLVSYANGEGFQRGTSITRDDEGDGACETVYLKDFKVLKPANVMWRNVHQFSFWAIVGLIAFCFVKIISVPYRFKSNS